MQDGRWRGAVSLGWKQNAAGEKIWKRRVITAATRHEVAEQMSELLGDRSRGLNIDPSKQTVGQFLSDWLVRIRRSHQRGRRPIAHTSRWCATIL